VRIGSREVSLTNLEKVFFPRVGLRKGDLIDFYLDVADLVLNHVRRRPMQMGLDERRLYPAEPSARPNGLPSESRQIAQRSPG
jgi:DNA primase